jgi:hypothetical protein
MGVLVGTSKTVLEGGRRFLGNMMVCGDGPSFYSRFVVWY